MVDNAKPTKNDDKSTSRNNKKYGGKKEKKYKPKKHKYSKLLSGFTGESTDLNGHVFETFSESKNTMQYENTMKALQVYAANKLRNGGDIVWLLKNEREFEISRPRAPNIPRSTRNNDNINQVEMDIYKENIKVFVSRQN